jgi:hypothetical protein
MATTTYLELDDQATGANNNTWGDVADANMAIIEQAIARMVSIATTGGTTVLTSAQNRYPIIRLTGTLASNATIEVRTAEKNWIFINDTTGAFTVTVKTNAGTGKTLPRGRAVKLYCDGTNVEHARAQGVPAAQAGGTADAITATFEPPFTAAELQDSTLVLVEAGNANATTTPTFAPDGLTARTITKNGGQALVAGDIRAAGHKLLLCYDLSSTRWELLNPYVAPTSAASDSAAGIVELATTTETLTGTDATRAVTSDALAALWEQGSDVASDTTISLGEGGYFNITGTTTITDIDFATDKAGRVAWVKFADALTLTHGAALILPGAANITTAAGDVACFVSEGTDVVRCTVYTKANGQPVVAPSAGSAVILGTISTASGSSANLGSLNLTDYKVIELWLLGVSCSGASSELFCGNSTSDDVAVTGSVPLAAELLNGVVHIDLADGKGVSACATTASTPLWRGINFDTALSTATTTITVSHSNGNFDAGSIRVVGYK